MTMSSRHNVLFLLIIALGLFTSVDQFCAALANKGIYTIENVGSKKCLSAGGVMRNSSNSNMALFKHGRAISKPCSNISSLSSTDFSQQWMIRIHKENPRKFMYQIQLAMLNTVYNDVNLTVELRGEFITYFPDEVYLKGREWMNKTALSQEFVISDPATEKCLTDGVEWKGVHFTKCKENGNFQKWNFTLVNEVHMVQNLLNMSIPIPL